jgi:hypothetical protein
MPSAAQYKLNEARAHVIVLMAVFTVLALALWFQPGRFDHTPSYANLLDIFHQPIWALAYAVAACLMAVSLRYHTSRVLVSITHTASIALLGTWWIAFIIRWATDSGTTPVNVVSWSVFLYIAARSALLVDSYSRPAKQ